MGKAPKCDVEEFNCVLILPTSFILLGLIMNIGSFAMTIQALYPDSALLNKFP